MPVKHKRLKWVNNENFKDNLHDSSRLLSRLVVGHENSLTHFLANRPDAQRKPGNVPFVAIASVLCRCFKAT